MDFIPDNCEQVWILAKDEKHIDNGIVKIDIGGGNVISSTISMGSIKELGLEVGKTAHAVIKVTSVMVGVEE